MIIRISPGDGGKDSRPISQWTKRAIIEAVRGRVSETDLKRLCGMSLEDLRSQLLMRDGTYITGSATIPGATRRTTYWKIDWAYLRRFLEGFE